MPTRILAALLFLLPFMAHAAPGKPAAAAETAPDIKAGILITESHDAIGQWVMTPGEGDSGRLRKVVRGKKIYVPIVVTGLKTTEFGKPGIGADLEFVAPGGKTMHHAKQCCGAQRGDPRTPGLVVLNPVLDLESEPGDPLGTYELRATVTYAGRTVSARETFELVAAATPAAAPAPQKPTRVHLDARECLKLEANRAIARCAEDFR